MDYGLWPNPPYELSAALEKPSYADKAPAHQVLAAAPRGCRVKLLGGQMQIATLWAVAMAGQSGLWLFVTGILPVVYIVWRDH